MASFRLSRMRFLTQLSGVAGFVALVLLIKSTASYDAGAVIDTVRFDDYEVRLYSRGPKELIAKICNSLPAKVSDLVYRVSGSQSLATARIYKNGRCVFAGCKGNFALIAEYGSNHVAGIDITGNGIPKVALVNDYGRQGGGSIFLFECGKQFRNIASINSIGQFPEFVDVDGDGIPELIVSDDAFYHWPVCRDGEPIPEVVLRWQNGRYMPAKDLMFKSAPLPADFETSAAQVRMSTAWNAASCSVPPELWTNAAALMYSGHEDLGWKFIDAGWKPGFPDKEKLTDYFLRTRLEQSAYWSDLRAE